jgi:hypothetical protein
MTAKEAMDAANDLERGERDPRGGCRWEPLTDDPGPVDVVAASVFTGPPSADQSGTFVHTRRLRTLSARAFA